MLHQPFRCDRKVNKSHHLTSDLPNIRSALHFWIRILIATILVVAAVLKILNVQDSFAHPGYGSFSGTNSVVVAIVELILAIWLLTRFLPSVSWGICGLLFGLYCLVSLEKAIAGESNCGCLGRISVNPWAMCVLDSLIAILIVRFFPNAEKLRLSQPTLVGAAAATIIAFLVLLMIQSNDTVARLFLHADVVISPQVVNIGAGESGNVVEKNLRITNIGIGPVTIYGARNTRTDNLISDLPMTLDPGRSESIRIICAFVGTKGGFGRRLFLYTTSEKTPQPYFTIVGVVE